MPYANYDFIAGGAAGMMEALVCHPLGMSTFADSISSFLYDRTELEN